jgi:hypothetical protein
VTFPYGSPELHWDAVVHALRSHDEVLVTSVIFVTRTVAEKLPYGTRKDIERVIAEELFHHRVPVEFQGDWAELNHYIGGLP